MNDPRGWKVQHKHRGKSQPSSVKHRGVEIQAVRASIFYVDRDWGRLFGGLVGDFHHRSLFCLGVCLKHWKTQGFKS